MNKKIVIFITLSVLILLAGASIVFKQNWKQFSDKKRKPQPQLLSGVVNNVTVFNEREEISLQQVIADSTRIMFRFPPHSCSCYELDFSKAVDLVKENLGESRVFAIINAENTKEIGFFCERTKLSGTVYSATDTIFALYEATQIPYACIVYPDMTAKNIVSVNPDNINELITHAKETFR